MKIAIRIGTLIFIVFKMHLCNFVAMSFSWYCFAQGKSVRRGAIVPEQYRSVVRVALQREPADQVHRSRIQRYRKRGLDTWSNRRWVELGIASFRISLLPPLLLSQTIRVSLFR